MKIAEVVVDRPVRGLDRAWSYAIPEGMDLVSGTRVEVPLGAGKAFGIVVAISDSKPAQIELKSVLAALDPYPVLTSEMIDLAHWMAERYVCFLPQALRAMIPSAVRRGMKPKVIWHYHTVGERTGRSSLKQTLWQWIHEHPQATRVEMQKVFTNPGTLLKALVAEGSVVATREIKGKEFRVNPSPYQLNEDQLAAISAIDSAPGRQWLLEGVTGSGKTEVYLAVLQKVLQRGGQALVLVPEIALTPQTWERFSARFPDSTYVWHSNLTDGERVQLWQAVQTDEPLVVIAARSGVFLPFQHLRLIVIDEEQETSYKQEDHPRYHAREVAIRRAKSFGATLILGSATPSLETAWNARQGHIGWIKLPSRVMQRSLPEMRVVDMRQELATGNRGMFSKTLMDAISAALEREQQVLLFLNRRGFSTFVLCRSCGKALGCPHCAVTLTYHSDQDHLRCHYCDFTMPMPTHCPACRSDKIRYFGAGTERVVAEVQRLWPQARIVRADRDSLTSRDSYYQLYRTFIQGQADVLVGTQMIAKGMDFPRVTVVGIVAADLGLHFPDFRSGERTFQLLVQSGGRAGRGIDPGQVVVQTYNPEHYAITHAVTQDVDAFVRQELEMRQELGYPPFGSLWLLELSGTDEGAVIQAAQQLGDQLSVRLANNAAVLGPSAAPLLKIRNHYRYHILVRTASNELAVSRTLLEMQSEHPELSITTDPYFML
ncbi:MAG: primosomal protein N' [Sulfobacillus benefaciens]|uniref:Replication restart protein PriA n=1 Tax=Sulfobacillus benefaciens TaxID=453960 RepID=A0A2T2XJP0_9FIRM|nr:MAG: primosomal protein N' [Sulfobacillus benefaciens]